MEESLGAASVNADTFNSLFVKSEAFSLLTSSQFISESFLSFSYSSTHSRNRPPGNNEYKGVALAENVASETFYVF